MNNTIRLSLVGCGMISARHVKGFGELIARGCRDIEYSAVCDTNEANAGRRAHELAAIQGKEPEVFTSVGALLRARVADGVDLCLPHHLHHTVGGEVLEGGLHVMIEKPLGITIKASRQLIETARRAKRLLATAENTRRSLGSRAIAWAINERKLIGEMRVGHVSYVCNTTFDFDDPTWKWRGVKLLNGGGMLIDSGVHFFDMQRVLFGEVDEVSCTTATYDRRIIADAPIFGDVEADAEDTFHADITFKSGMQLQCNYSRSLPGASASFGHYFGSEGAIEDLGWPIHPFETGGRATLADGTILSKDDIEREYLLSLGDEQKARLFPYGCTLHFGVDIWDFADSIRKNRRPEIDGEEGLRTKAVCEACYESATAGTPVKYDAVLNGDINAYQKPIDEYWKI